MIVVSRLHTNGVQTGREADSRAVPAKDLTRRADLL
jgi:hypothetical protein